MGMSGHSCVNILLCMCNFVCMSCFFSEVPNNHLSEKDFQKGF